MTKSATAPLLRPEFEALFDEGERAQARRRLADYGFDVDAALRAFDPSA